MNRKLWTILLAFALMFSLSIISGCQKAKETTVKTTKKAVKAPTETASLAIPSGEDIRKHIFEQIPYQKWALWPGKEKLSKGTEPHGAFVTVYVNYAALDSINKAAGMAENSIVVKENYDLNKKLTSITTMMKVTGYNPEGGDWLWVRFGPDSKLTDEGKVKMCLVCHTAAKANDYIYTGQVTASGLPASTAPGYGNKNNK